MIRKSLLNGPSAISLGKKSMGIPNVGRRHAKVRVSLATESMRGGKVIPKKMTGYEMHTSYSFKKQSGRVNSKHPDAAPRINFLHMN